MTLDIRTLVAAKSKEPLVVQVEGLGDVLFYPPSVADIEQGNKDNNHSERGYWFLWKMLEPANPGLTVEEIKSWPFHITQMISDAIEEKLGFRARP